MSLRSGQGTIAFWANGGHSDWATNSNSYSFGSSPVSPDGVRVESMKHPDKTIEVKASDGQDTVTFRHPIPLVPPQGLHVVVTWENGEVKLYLGGSPVETKKLPTP
jgi:hypothetical protein